MFAAVIVWLWLAMRKKFFILTAFSTAASTLRPNGFVFLAAAISLVALERIKDRKVRVFSVLALWICLYVMIAIFGPRVSPWVEIAVRSVTDGRVIYGHPEMAVIIHNRIDVIFTMLKRVTWELAQVRPWYSYRLNLFIIVCMTSFYALAIRGAWLTRKSRLFWMTILISLPFLCIVAFTWAIHEGRFAWCSLVAWIPWVALGCQHSKRVRQL